MVVFFEQLVKGMVLCMDGLAILLVLACLAVFGFSKCYFSTKKRSITINGKIAKTVGFFHPYANSCGGGEKVLWGAVQGLQEIAEFQPIHCVIYTGDKESKEEILKKTKDILHFNINPSFSLEIVHLSSRKWLEASNYPHFTMLLQSLASMVVVIDGLKQFVPDIFFDTTGLAFTYPIVKMLTGATVLSYTHYPTISTDMLQRVREKRTTYNNDAFVSNSTTVSTLKLIYYKLFSAVYGVVGRSADMVMVNGTWTYNHIISQWRQPEKTSIVYPPCDTSDHRTLGLGEPRRRDILSIGQFRPEKDHIKQLYILRKLLDIDDQYSDVRLILVGGCRNKEDEERVAELKRIVVDLDLTNHVVFEVNAPYSQLQHYLATSLIGLHTMWNEHFGICVVEMIAAGLIVVAHNSAGPKEDIIVPAYPQTNGVYSLDTLHSGEKPVGFLAASVDEYVTALSFILSHEREMRDVSNNAREKSRIFSTERFVKIMKDNIVQMLD
ncbi:hypothetical protein WA171_002994 [Blastocystis sp. BT1]